MNTAPSVHQSCSPGWRRPGISPLRHGWTTSSETEDEDAVAVSPAFEKTEQSIIPITRDKSHRIDTSSVCEHVCLLEMIKRYVQCNGISDLTPLTDAGI